MDADSCVYEFRRLVGCVTTEDGVDEPVLAELERCAHSLAHVQLSPRLYKEVQSVVMQLWDVASALAFLNELDAACARARQVCSETVALLPDDSPSIIQVGCE